MKRLLRVVGTLLSSCLSGYCVACLFSWLLPFTYSFNWLSVAIYFLAIVSVYKILVFCMMPLNILNRYIVGADKLCVVLGDIAYFIFALHAIYTCFSLDGLSYGIKEIVVSIINTCLITEVYCSMFYPYYIKKHENIID